MFTKTLIIILGTLLFQTSAQNIPEESTIVPFLVSLRHLNNTHFCDGALIDAKWILTTRMCIDGMDQNDIIAVVGLKQFKNGPKYLPGYTYPDEIYDNEIAVDENNGKMFIEPLRENQILKLVDIITSQDLNGLAMLEISPSVNSSDVFPIKLYLNKSEDAVMIGWGIVNTSDFYSYQVANDDYCKNTFGIFFNENLQMCFVPSENTLCFGNQGSPIIVDNKLFGIMSESSSSTTAVAFKVSEYNQWIVDTIAERGYVKWFFDWLSAILFSYE